MPDFRPGLREGAGLYATVDPYPLARQDRGAAIPINSSLPPVLGVPKVFLWSGHLRNAGANLHAVVTSRRIVGPAFLDELSFTVALGAGSGNSPKFILGFSTSNVPEGNDLADSALAQVTPLVEQDFRDDGGFTAAGLDGIYQSSSANALGRTVRLGRPIQASEFFLVAAVRDAGDALAYIVDFQLRVLENVEPDILAELVLS